MVAEKINKDYETALEKLYKEVKVVKIGDSRFEIPEVEGHIQGNKTIISNFAQICSILRRDCGHVAKFLARDLATQGKIEGKRLILNRKVPSVKINQKIEDYAKEFVICRECKKPDTELIKKGPYLFLHCLACGAKHSVRAKIQ